MRRFHCFSTSSLVPLGALAAMLLMGPLWAAAPSQQQLQALEAAYNGDGDLGRLLKSGPDLDAAEVERRRQLLQTQFPDARWSLNPGPTLRDGRRTVWLRVRGTRQDGPLRFRLQAEQQLSLESDGRVITGQRVIREQSLLRSGTAALPVTLQIPDAVLTGQRYDVDVVFDEPLDGAIMAGGILELSPRQVSAFDNPAVKIGALGGGGLFRNVQAPFTPGTQTWAVLLLHPDGLVSVSKRVRVVSDKSELDL